MKNKRKKFRGVILDKKLTLISPFFGEWKMRKLGLREITYKGVKITYRDILKFSEVLAYT